jgi:hypothetical protein
VVTLTGSGFDATPDLNRVALGTAAAVVLAAAPNALAISVPPEARTGPARISVQAAGGRAESHERFVVERADVVVDPVGAAAGAPTSWSRRRSARRQGPTARSVPAAPSLPFREPWMMPAAE